MSLTINVTYPKRIQIDQGTPVKVMGTWTTIDHISAKFIDDGRREISFQLTPDEYPSVTEYTGTLPHPELLTGEVVHSQQFGEQTHLRVMPFEQHLYDYNRVSNAWARSAVPAYWNLLDQKRKWESCFRDANSKLAELRQKETQPYDASQLVLSMHKYAQVQEQFRLEYCTRYLWQSIEKQLIAERHLERLEVLSDLQNHFDIASNRDIRELLIMRVNDEASIVFEAAVTAIYSSLDVLSHVINQIYELNIPDDRISFTGILTDKYADTENEEIVSPLQNQYPNDPLTKFLITERQGWIQDLAKWRNYIIHHGCIQGGMWARLVTDSKSLMPDADQEGEVRELTQKWTKRLRALLEQVVGFMSTYIDRKTDSLPAVDEKTKTNIPSPNKSHTIEIMEHFLGLWKMSTDLKPERLKFMYSRLTDTSRNKWPFQKFCRYIEKHPLLNWQFNDGIMRTSDELGNESYSFSVQMEFAEETLSWRFILRPDNMLIFKIDIVTSLSIPPALPRRTQVLQFGRHQSDKETGYREMIFSCTVMNISQHPIQNVALDIFWTDISNATAEVTKVLLPHETHICIASWEGAFLPIENILPPMANQLTGEITARVTYRLATKEGNCWAESTLIPPGNIQPF